MRPPSFSDDTHQILDRVRLLLQSFIHINSQVSTNYIHFIRLYLTYDNLIMSPFYVVFIHVIGIDK